MSAEHTSGKWVPYDLDTEHPSVISEQGKRSYWDNPTVCNLHEDVTPDDSVTIGRWYKKFDNATANAHLISAAPDLLNALKAMLAVTSGQCIYNFMEAERALAAAAVAKAEGCV